jgi:hypothetical protein
MQVSKLAVRHVAALAGLILTATIGQAVAQQPTQAQRDAIRQSCRSDFMANCSGVTPGGKEALDCLKQNLAKLSAPCQAAVNAITPAAPASAPAPAATVAPTAPQAPSAAAPSAPKPSAVAKPAIPKPASAPAAKLHPAPPSPPPAAAAPAPTVPPLTPRPFILLQRRLAIVGMCRVDVAKLCADIPPGQDRIIDCLAANASSLMPQCYNAIARVSR